MRAEVIQKLKDVNKEFYQNFADSFSRTRGRIQPGVRRILETLPRTGNWLDIGCGNGNFASALFESGRTGLYTGLDASAGLIEKAEKQLSSGSIHPDPVYRFLCVDITEDEWQSDLPETRWSHIFLFAVLHHIPGEKARMDFCQKMHEMMDDDCILHLSVWQVRNSKRLQKRIQPWERIQLTVGDVDAGDMLMDWRASMEGQEGQFGLRYVHNFDADELVKLAANCGFQITDLFFSDGKEGNLGLYQSWQRI